MKRVALLTVFFYVCTFAAPQRSQAAVPVALIAAAAVGTAMMSASIGTYYAQNGVLPEYVSATAGAVASAADKIFQPSYLAMGAYSLLTPEHLSTAKDYYVGKAAAVGATIGDICDFVKNSADGLYSNLKSLIASHSVSSAIDLGDLTAGSILASSSGQNYVLASSASRTGASWATPTQFKNTMYSIGASAVPGYSNLYLEVSAGKLWFQDMTVAIANSYGTLDYGYNYVPITAISNPATLSPSVSIDYPGLKDALNPTVPGSVAAEIPNIIKNMPASQVSASSATPTTADDTASPPAITQADINAALKANTAAVAQAVAQAAADIAAANPDDAAAQIAAAQAALEAAQAAEEAAQEEPAAEIFSPISDSAFTEPYNPGEFDIPARFTQFLNNVKSSGLFSFSNDFFNSLPGGGSSVYEIEAGRYGHHTIDLSATLSTGLAVLKTILLVCFGFLSIRAVIMKR